MVETVLRTDTTRSGWYTPEEVQYLAPDGLRWRIVSRPYTWRPPTDVFEMEDAMVVRIEIAGVRESDFEIALEGQTLVIHGTRQDVAERRAYHQMEIPFGDFGVEIDLPVPVEGQQVQAVYRDGFLRVTLPKVQPRQIRIKE